MRMLHRLRQSEPLLRGLQKYVHSIACFHLQDDDGVPVRVLHFPAKATLIEEDVPQFRLQGEQVGLSLEELVSIHDSYSRHYSTPISLDETIELFTKQAALLRACSAGALAPSGAGVKGRVADTVE